MKLIIFKMRKIIFINIHILFLLTTKLWCQDKVIILPKKFSAFNTENEYNLNNLTKMAFEHNGFKVILENELKKEHFENRCNMLSVDIFDLGSSFSSTLKVVLKDCVNNIVYESGSGKSKEKKLFKSYNLAFRNAEKTIDYDKIKKTIDSINIKTNKTLDVENVKNQIENKSDTIYIAKSIENGFQLIDENNKIIYEIYFTSQKDIFTTLKNNQQGILLKSNNQWFFEFAKDGKINRELVKIKF